ncbi:energy transducer TonB [Maribacter sp. 2210JD10-5]|uniref:energy transducer TonB n=1 Tax=Maribacter sp. 2210JD10-5 TaxID=3386272 RepID=UPI0039BC3E9B
MEPKKNPKKDLNKKSGLYFVIGLLSVMALSYIALEWKTYDNAYKPDIGMNDVDELLDEEAPVFQLETLPPPPPAPVIPTEIEVVEDDDPIIETIIDAVDTDQDKEVLEADDFEIIEVPVDVTVPFSVIEDVPVFPGCENTKDKRSCFNKMMQKHIRKVFKYPTIAQEMGVQGKVYTTFTIEKDGTIGDIKFRGPDKNLEQEAVRIISKLPKMTPGKQRGNAVKVPFSIPITFKLQ